MGVERQESKRTVPQARDVQGRREVEKLPLGGRGSWSGSWGSQPVGAHRCRAVSHKDEGNMFIVGGCHEGWHSLAIDTLVLVRELAVVEVWKPRELAPGAPVQPLERSDGCCN